MDSQQAAFDKFKAAGPGKKFSREVRNSEGDGASTREFDGPVPDLYSIHHGRVMKVEDFGAFIQIPEFKKHGLVHKSQASNHITEHMSDVVAVGDHVWVKVTSTQDNKIALSMKHVSQGDGTDLDPNLVKFTGEQDRRRTHTGFMDKKPISVEEGGVFLKTVCKKCGAAGHLATECFSGGGQYDLLPDEDDEDQNVGRAPRSGEKEKKKKRDKDDEKDRSRDKDRHRDKGREKDRDRDRESRRDHKDHREKNEPSSHRKEKRRERSRSPSPKRRSADQRSKVESLEDALAVMRARKHRRRSRHDGGNSDESEDGEDAKKRDHRRSDHPKRSRSRTRSRSPRRHDDRKDRRDSSRSDGHSHGGHYRR